MVVAITRDTIGHTLTPFSNNKTLFHCHLVLYAVSSVENLSSKMFYNVKISVISSFSFYNKNISMRKCFLFQESLSGGFSCFQINILTNVKHPK